MDSENTYSKKRTLTFSNLLSNTNLNYYINKKIKLENDSETESEADTETESEADTETESEADTESENEDNEDNENNEDSNSNNPITKTFIIIKPMKFDFMSNNSNGLGGPDEPEDDSDDSDYENKSDKPKDKNNTKKPNKSNVKTNEVKYFDSSDSSDSENEDLDTSDPKKFALNLLKKVKRHNLKEKPEIVAQKFNLKVKSMDKKYKEYSRNPSQYKGLRQYYKNMSECKNLYNMLMDDIEFFGTKFNFNKFISKYNKPKKNISNDLLDNSTSNRQPNILDLIFNSIGRDGEQKSTSSSSSKLDDEFKDLYDRDNKSHHSGLKYFKTLNKKLKLDYIDKLKKINSQMDKEDKRPNYMKVLDMEMEESNKSLILQRIQQMEGKPFGDSKLKNWINKVMGIPFGTYIKPPVSKTDSVEKIKEYLGGVRKLLDSEVYGHQATKDQLVKILAHTITNPQEGGNVFALQGPPGIGKTALIQDGISKALGRPFAFISLGGATDASFLEGHDFTYEGSQHGRIVEILQQAKCMNPVIYFDELDKVSETPKGEEIINILMHLTDSTQNSHFNDKYFGGINFDLSKAIIIFSFNEEHKVSRILRDRMKIIRVKGYKMLDKINIARDYLIPKLLKQIGLDDIKIEISEKLLEFMIDTYTNEGGVRKLKEMLNDIFLEINLRKLEGNVDWVNTFTNKKMKRACDSNVLFPKEIILTESMVEKDFLKKKHKITHLKINPEPMVGIVNGLWANDLGVGGLVPIECCWIPSTDKLSLNLTGMQGDVMKESMSVARSVAWRILPDTIKSRLNERFKESVDNGIHIHCPDGATPKDGPSAGGAITTCLISLLTGTKVSNKIAMTGEINLKGHITAIGGLEEKIFGAKKAGAKLVLCPKENSRDLDEIKEKYPTLFDGEFEAKTVETIWEVLNEVISEPIDWIRFD
jgi:endopeptidase La